MTNHSLRGLAVLGWLAAASINASQLAPPPQTPSQPPVFDVAAIRPTDPSAPRGDCFMKGQPGGQTFVGRCIPVRLIIMYAYKLIPSQLVGGPSWLDNELYDFEAKSDRSVTRAEVASMFQAFLADRFKLQFHRETRTLPAFLLTVDKGGSKMKPNESSYEWDIPVTNIPGPMPKIKGTRCPMSYLSWWIGQREGRPVVDKTDLPGFWDFTLEYVPEGRESMAGLEGPSLSTALREQLGLKLESQKGPVEIYVIDHVQKPSE